MDVVVDRAGAVLAYVFKPQSAPAKTTFITPDDAALQVGYVVYPAGGTVAPHAHLPLARSVKGTPEVIIVDRGRCSLDIYDDARHLVRTVELSERDLVVLLGGGHGFHMREDTVLLEVKQGPYLGPAEKERFVP